jgi:hypothetical protein
MNILDRVVPTGYFGDFFEVDFLGLVSIFGDGEALISLFVRDFVAFVFRYRFTSTILRNFFPSAGEKKYLSLEIPELSFLRFTIFCVHPSPISGHGKVHSMAPAGRVGFVGDLMGTNPAADLPGEDDDTAGAQGALLAAAAAGGEAMADVVFILKKLLIETFFLTGSLEVFLFSCSVAAAGGLLPTSLSDPAVLAFIMTGRCRCD